MALKDPLRIIDQMATAGIIGPYALCGAVAAYNDVEASVIEDLDLLVKLRSSGSGMPSTVSHCAILPP